MGDASTTGLIAVLQRWRDAGGTLSIVSHRDGTSIVALCTCDGGEEMDRLVTSEPAACAWIAENARLTA
jgi:carbonic anhydrase